MPCIPSGSVGLGHLGRSRAFGALDHLRQVLAERRATERRGQGHHGAGVVVAEGRGREAGVVLCQNQMLTDVVRVVALDVAGMAQPVTKTRVLVAALPHDEEGNRRAIELLLSLETREGQSDLVLADRRLGENHDALVIVELGRRCRAATTPLVAVVERIDRGPFEERRVLGVARQTLGIAVLAVDVGFTVGFEPGDGGCGLAALASDVELDARRSTLGRLA